MAKRGLGDDKGGSGNIAALGIMGVIFFVVVWAIWRPFISRAMVNVGVAESKLLLKISPLLPQTYEDELRVSAIKGSLANCAGRVARPGETPKLIIRGTRYVCSYSIKPWKNVTLAQAAKSWSVPSKVMVVPSLLIFLLMALHVRSTDIAKKYRRTFNLEGFIKHMAKFHPHLRPIVNLRLDLEPPRGSPWEIKLTYIEFALRHKLLRDGLGRLITERQMNSSAYYFDAAICKDVFARQLGKPWPGSSSKLPPYQRAIFGAWAALIAQKREECVKALNQIASSFKHDTKTNKFTINPELALALADKYESEPMVQELIRRHFHVTTLLMSMLELGRDRGGNMCSSMFIWLKPMHRTLFYALHQVGLREPNMESAGIFEHRHAELRDGFPISTPQVGQAVLGIERALQGESWLVRHCAHWVEPSEESTEAVVDATTVAKKAA